MQLTNLTGKYIRWKTKKNSFGDKQAKKKINKLKNKQNKNVSA